MCSKKDRTDNKVITVLDSTGIAIEDVTVTKLTYFVAKQTMFIH
ncbi:hypothetical protein ACFLXD_00760 [Chloroflexota bacterium]